MLVFLLLMNASGFAIMLLDKNLARCHRRRVPEALLLAFEADQTKWYTLVLVLWSAKRIEATDTLSWALRRLRSDFPSRYEALVKERQWFLKYA